MLRKCAFLMVLAVLLLSGCVRAVYNETPTPPPTVTPLIPFDLAPAVTPTTALPAALYMNPSFVDLAVGERATIDLWLDSIRRLNRIRFELSFDPARLQIEDADAAAEGVQIAAGSMLQPAAGGENRVSAAEGLIVYEVALEPGRAVDGSGIVASIAMRGLSEGQTQLGLNAVAFDPEGNPLELQVLATGTVIVSAMAAAQPPPPPVIQPTPPPVVQPTAPPPIQPTAARPGQGVYYIVKPGDNLYRIGLTFGTTSEAIAAANDIGDPLQLSAGTMIVVPVAPPRGRFGYYVQPGDTLYSVATRFGVTVEQVAAWSGLGTDYTIRVGQILTVSP